MSSFAMYVRATGKGRATRYGSPHQPLGWRRVPETGDIEHDTLTVHALTEQEALKYRREYQRQIKEGALELVDEEAYHAAQKKRQELAVEAKKKADAEKAKAEAAEKKAAKEKAEAKAKLEAEKAEKKKAKTDQESEGPKKGADK